jgi:hypothetical protein
LKETEVCGEIHATVEYLAELLESNERAYGYREHDRYFVVGWNYQEGSV